MNISRIVKRFSQNIQHLRFDPSASQSIIQQNGQYNQYIPLRSNYQQAQHQQVTYNELVNTKKATVIPITNSFQNAKNIFDFAKFAGDLKALKRTGWKRFPEIKEIESVADHSWRMSLFCMLFAKDKSIDLERCIKFAIIHDLAEAVVGDITPYDGISDEQKRAMEDEGIKLLLSKIENDDIRNEFHSLYVQYEDRKCPESKLVKDIDRYEMMYQAFEYEQKYPGIDLSEFFTHANKINHPVIRSWLKELQDRRSLYLKQQIQK